MKTYQKQKPFRSTKYLEFVRSFNCQACGTNQRIQAHHLIGHGDGAMGSKADDRLTMALCSMCHRMLHDDPKGFDYGYSRHRMSGQVAMINVMLGRARLAQELTPQQIEEAREILQ